MTNTDQSPADDRKPIIAIDFDGVIHSYEHGWQDGKIYGHVTPGFFEWAERTRQHFELVIYSTRSSTWAGRMAMESWLTVEFENWCRDTDHMPALGLQFAHEKPKAWLTIDDRCIRFRGDWNTWELRDDTMMQFKAWMQDA